jgi:hypothetical protein
MLTQDAQMYGVELQTKASIISDSKKSEAMYGRLSEKYVIDRSNFLAKQAETFEHELKLEKASITRQSALMKIKVMAET